MMKSVLVSSSAVAVAGLSFTSVPVAAQDASYEVPGIVAWTTAKTYGFTFHPEAASGESVTHPLDGMNTLLKRTEKTLLITKTFTVAQTVGGQPSVNAGERTTNFTFFGGRTLQPGWTVKSVDLGGNFVYVQQPRLGTSDLSFRVRLASGGGATLRKIVLTGPPGADWHDAFSAPVRKDYVINGVVAWNAAKKYGFTFTPLKTGYPTKAALWGQPDGVFTALVVYSMRDPCTMLPRSAYVPGIDRSCIAGQIVGGNISVTAPILTIDQTVEFEMFGGKKLSPGWIVKSVSVSNGTWTRQPIAGSDDLKFVLKVTSYGDKSAIAIVNSVTLEGPSNAAGFEDAFKGGQ